MTGAFFNFLIIAAVFSLLIIAHEFGHFIVARLFGVRVTDFAIGFGPALFKKKIKETNFLLCVIPLGGYVKMAGDSRAESRGHKDEFFSKPPGIRSLIVGAGALFNYALAFIVLVTIVTIGFPVQDAVVGAVRKGSPAKEAGIRADDKIISVNNKKVESWSELQDNIFKSEDSVELVISREGEKIRLEVGLERGEALDRLGRAVEVSRIGITPYGPLVGKVLEGYPAYEAGIETGDKILEINGKEIVSWEDVVEEIKEAEESVALKLKREGEVFALTVPVKKEKQPGLETDSQEYVSVIGIQPYTRDKVLKYPFPFSLGRGAGMLFRTTALSLKGIWHLIADPSLSFRESVAGPIYISYMITRTAEMGIIALLHLVALLNIFLFIINLFPIPVLDGGHLLFFGIEKLRKKPLSQKSEEMFTRIGFALIIVLVFFVFYNDIVRRGPEIWESVKNSFSQESQLIE